MSTLRGWAAKHGISLAAVVELEAAMGIAARGANPLNPNVASAATYADPQGSEAYQQSLVRLEAARAGVRLFRNNSGAYKDTNGRMVRYGLGNDSKQVNEVFKSPDLVGWRKTLITPEMVGTFIAQTVLREMKPEDWQFSGDAHEQGQLNFINLCVADGGDARFCTGPGTL